MACLNAVVYQIDEPLKCIPTLCPARPAAAERSVHQPLHHDRSFGPSAVPSMRACSSLAPHRQVAKPELGRDVALKRQQLCLGYGARKPQLPTAG